MSDAKKPEAKPCARCKKPALPRPGNRWFPFCSANCRQADLGAWFLESYRIPGPPAEIADDNPTPFDAEPPDDPPTLH